MSLKLGTIFLFILVITQSIISNGSVLCHSLFSDSKAKDHFMQIKNLDELLNQEILTDKYITLPENVSISEIEDISTKLLGNQVYRVVMELDISSLNPQVATKPPLLFEDIDKDLASNLMKFTIDEALSGRMNFLSTEDKASFGVALDKAVYSGKSARLSANNNIMGFMNWRDVEFDGEVKTLAAWIWARHDLTQDEKLTLRKAFLLKLTESSQDKIVASIHFKNLYSIAFFSKLGFKLKWIMLKKG